MASEAGTKRIMIVRRLAALKELQRARQKELSDIRSEIRELSNDLLELDRQAAPTMEMDDADMPAANEAVTTSVASKRLETKPADARVPIKTFAGPSSSAFTSGPDFVTIKGKEERRQVIQNIDTRTEHDQAVFGKPGALVKVERKNYEKMTKAKFIKFLCAWFVLKKVAGVDPETAATEAMNYVFDQRSYTISTRLVREYQKPAKKRRRILVPGLDTPLHEDHQNST